MMTFQTEPPGTPHIPSSTADFPPQALNINIRSSWGIVLQTANLLLQFQLFSGTAHTPPTIIGLRAQQYTRIGKTPPTVSFDNTFVTSHVNVVRVVLVFVPTFGGS